ncbi:hypothetical protein A3A71_01805 [Candidatus Berkelbacteria bacterium RIFCSPLOWO2_01_FULL_50_28]|uniref:DNA polymerase III subunit delta n=1 Tax=Candidatus Berkelbacteria bacterium RIFCSPLOWO2_01_FULL_50_28 TaxID=1797471 RepID=A0A1F5EBX2_9BACT|nr:MAG: hypothetical protein A3F39_01655 [Candidatus Berkelbacteria bacterium RIFCSPHIGHO2_12_FULL_50_11]OGD64766.1 MAG: hypothetical protein A3A71_01805 [Candidatus Berkelbacteria bacterium RIFCSPLOWO2_01_FULL_50_28]
MLESKAYLVRETLNNLLARLKSVAQIDRLTIDGATIKVGELRLIIAQVSQRSLGDRRVLIIERAEELDEICQSTLLKLLEEPNESLAIFLLVSNPSKLLPTITSRLHQLDAESSAAILQNGERLQSSPQELERQLAACSSRETLIELLSSELESQRHELLSSYNAQAPQRIETLTKVITRLKNNANLKLTVDYLRLNWH